MEAVKCIKTEINEKPTGLHAIKQICDTKF